MSFWMYVPKIDSRMPRSVVPTVASAPPNFDGWSCRKAASDGKVNVPLVPCRDPSLSCILSNEKPIFIP